MQLIINDANILIDLVKLNLTEAFLQLSFKMATTDFVFTELYDEQKAYYNDRIKIITSDGEDLLQIMAMKTQTNVSVQDCSVWYHAKKSNGTVLTGDKKLRKEATKDQIQVRGILYVFDQLVSQGIINEQTAAQKLQELYSFNKRLPHKEVQKRITMWCGVE